jgi:hypothetical protein
MRFVIALAALLLSVTALAAETLHLTFVSEYVREIGVNEELRELAAKEVAEPGADKNAAMIRSGTRIVLELNSQVAMLKGMSLNPPFDKVPGAIAAFYEQKINAYNRMIAMASAFVQGPKPGVDYGALAAEAPKLTAMIEYIDRSIFQATPLIFATLIADKPDSQGRMSRLRITRAERDELVRSLQISFGEKMDQTDQNWIVSSATVLRDYLIKKGYKCSDDPQ